ncbi:MAG TPA: hypothetical protein P5277_00575 [Candidatus Paceibacterota bacterium]|nr:hypothetical protein [Candidatus Paceibacterota bacterium]
MAWKTYLIIYFGAKNKKPSEVGRAMEKLGFEGKMGPVDFIYTWKQQPTKEQIFALGDKISDALKDSGAVFNLDTHD